MGNMSYCRFENTSSDLQDCLSAVEGMGENQNLSEEARDMNQVEIYSDLSITEKAALNNMIAQCEQFIEAAGELIEDNPDPFV